MPQKYQSIQSSLEESPFPHLEKITAALAENIIEIPAKTQFLRAVRHSASIWPAQANRTFRFGPPDSMKNHAGQYPFHWIYIAANMFTAAWEARLCVNDVTRPGTFYIVEGADNAMICTFTFSCPLRLVDLTGQVVSKLGIFDQLANPEYDWSQAFGVLLDLSLENLPGDVDGFRYMSRKHPGHYAFAVSSRAMKRLDSYRTTAVELFGATDLYVQLQRDPSFVLPPI